MRLYSEMRPSFLTLPILVVLFITSPPASATRRLSHAPLRKFRLDLTRLDIPPAGKLSYAHLQQAFHRTSLRVARFHYILQLHAGGAAAFLSSSNPSQLDTLSSSRNPVLPDSTGAASLATISIGTPLVSVNVTGGTGSYRTPVFPDSTGAAFLSTLSIGTPPVSVNVIVDTGSDLLWVQCKPCTSCFSHGPATTIFDPSLSSSYSRLPCSNAFCSHVPHNCSTSTTASCSYSYSYGDQSFTIGDLSLETLTLPDVSGTLQHIASVTFGCGHNNTLTVSGSSADGIVGLDLDALSLPSQLGVSYISYCLQSINESKTSALFLGDAAEVPEHSDGPMITTPFFRNPVLDVPLYYVQLNGISVGEQLVMETSNGAFDIQSNGRGGMVFDSGSTLTVLTSNIYNAIVDAFKSAIPLPPVTKDSFLCYSLRDASNIQFPSLTYHFEGADLDLPVDNYFVGFEDENVICLTLGPSGPLPLSIFGNLHQQNFFTTYDLQAQTISLTPTSCTS